MLRALINDLTMIAALEILSTHDCRVSPMCDSVTSHEVARQADLWPFWRRFSTKVDAICPIAPESDDVLERVNRVAQHTCAGLLGARPNAVRVAASQLARAVLDLWTRKREAVREAVHVR